MIQAHDPGRRVTVVVPVYGDWPSLRDCIDSLHQHVDPRHDVILVNDCGPDADAMEENILARIAGRDNYRYFRNEANLGFAKTCNRAAVELDNSENDVLLLNSDTIVTEGFIEEMLAVLYASEKHGCVCPRSNNATIASVPFKYKDAKTSDRGLAHAAAIHTLMKSEIPRFTVVPVTPGFCMLIKRQLIANFGLFDPAYGLGYNEENDFCLRINKYGYSAVMANHAIVFHLESRSFSPQKKAQLQKVNDRLLRKRYPYYDDMVGKYLTSYIEAEDWFADAIYGAKSKIKVMINLHHLPTAFNGSAKNAIGLLRYINENSQKFEHVEFTVVANPNAAAFHSLESYGLRIVGGHEVDELFDVGYCPYQIFHAETLHIMNKHCVKIVFSHLDIIAIRTNRLLANDFAVRNVLLDAFHAADRVIAISDFTSRDAVDYYGLDKAIADKFVTVRQGYQQDPMFDGSSLSELDPILLSRIRSGGYILVLGNDFDHKLVHEVLPTLGDSATPIITLGPTALEQATNVHSIPSGDLSDSAVDELFANCKLVLFPSVYEGFGLPIAEAAKFRKPIVVFDSEVAREICALYESAIPVGYFSLLSEVPTVVEKTLKHTVVEKTLKHTVAEVAGQPLRTLDDYMHDVTNIIVDVAREKVDVAHIRARWSYLTRMAEYAYPHSAAVRIKAIERTLIRWKHRHPESYLILRYLYRKWIKGPLTAQLPFGAPATKP